MSKQLEENVQPLVDTYGRDAPQAAKFGQGIIGPNHQAAQAAQDARRSLHDYGSRRSDSK